MEILLDTVIPMAAMPQVTELLVIMHQVETVAQILEAEAVEALTITGIIRAVKADREL
jgi:glutamine phosphoribosylpyrophosphate amidotransferase